MCVNISLEAFRAMVAHVDRVTVSIIAAGCHCHVEDPGLLQYVKMFRQSRQLHSISR